MQVELLSCLIELLAQLRLARRNLPSGRTHEVVAAHVQNLRPAAAKRRVGEQIICEAPDNASARASDAPTSPPKAERVGGYCCAADPQGYTGPQGHSSRLTRTLTRPQGHRLLQQARPTGAHRQQAPQYALSTRHVQYCGSPATRQRNKELNHYTTTRRHQDAARRATQGYSRYTLH